MGKLRARTCGKSETLRVALSLQKVRIGFRMLPSLSLLEPRLVDRILAEAFALISERGVTVQAQAAVELLSAAGARVENGIAHIPEPLARHALESVPREFSLLQPWRRTGREIWWKQRAV